MGERIVIKNNLSPGDVIVLSAAVRDINLAYPGKFDMMLDTSTPAVWQGNPFLKYFSKNGVRSIKANYPLIHKSNQGRLHFIWGFLEDLNRQLNVNAPLTDLRPALYMTEEERRGPPTQLKKPYWVMVSGGKKDFTAKWWDAKSWQDVVNRLAPSRTIVQVGSNGHVHPKLVNVVDLVGKTNMRELMQLIYHAEGVLCIVTCLAHIAAAFNKPCISVAGGREPWWWEAYTNETRTLSMRKSSPSWVAPQDGYVDQAYLHTMDQLPCCKGRGCWKTHVGDRPNKCVQQVKVNGIDLPRCMTMITPDMVVKAVENYFGGTLNANTPELKTPIPDGVNVATASMPMLPEQRLENAGRHIFRPPTIIPSTPVVSIETLNVKKIECYADGNTAKDWIADGLPMTTGTASVRKEAALRSEAEWILWVGAGAKPNDKQWLNRLKTELTADAVGFVGWKPYKAEYEETLKKSTWYREQAWESEGRVHTFTGNCFAIKGKLFKEIFNNLNLVSDDMAAVAASEYCRRKGLRRRNASTWLIPL